jgi:preprotein translocase subunit SecF
MQVKFAGARPGVTELTKTLESIGLHPVVQPVGDQADIIRTESMDTATHEKTLEAVKKQFGDITEERFDSIGPALGKELERRTIISIIIASLAIILYIAFAFRKVSRPVASWKFGMIAIVALLHDLAILTGVFVLLGKFFGTEIGAPFVAALLTTLGYSVNDTIVIFDRIREKLTQSREPFPELVNRAVNETLTRSINSSLTPVLAMVAVYFFGGASIKDFALALIIGIVVGTYSSIFVASPLLVLWSGRKRK